MAHESGDPTDPCYAQFVPSGNGMIGLGAAQVPTVAGPDGSVRPGGFDRLTAGSWWRGGACRFDEKLSER